MTDLSLYKSCLRKIAINLRDGIYKLCHENPFSFMPSKIVDDLMSAALDHKRADGLRADDLEQLLTSGKLRELKISDMGVHDLIPEFQTLIQVLYFLKSGCQKLETLHLPVFDDYKAWMRSEASVARTRSEVFAVKLRSEVCEALGSLLRNTPNLKDLHCCFSFDLKALRNCRKLRRLSLHFEPQQHWFEFIEEENDHFQTHKYLEFFTVCVIDECKQIPYDDVVMILRHCPELTSLGFMESSGALSQLYRMDTSPFESNLRYCCWRDIEYDWQEDPSQPPENGLHRVEEAVLNYPMIEELDFDGCCMRSISCLKNLRNLVYLNIELHDGVSGTAFNDALQAIGSQLKHLSFSNGSQMDVSLLLQNCHNLESFRIGGYKFTEFANSAVSLPNLQRLTFEYMHGNGRQIFRLLCDCNQLTELFLRVATYFDDQTLYHFLERNSLSKLKVAFLTRCGLTEHGFREFLLNAPQLEKVRINSNDERFRSKHYERVITETNHKALCNKHLHLAEDEFFQKRSNFYKRVCELN